MEDHKNNFEELVQFTKRYSKEDKPEAQYGCLLIDTEGNKFLAVTAYGKCTDLTDRAFKYSEVDYAVKRAGNCWVEDGRKNELVTAYCIPCFPCGVDQVMLQAFGVKTLVVPRAHPVITERWVNFDINDSIKMFLNKKLNMNLIYYDKNIFPEIHDDDDDKKEMTVQEKKQKIEVKKVYVKCASVIDHTVFFYTTAGYRGFQIGSTKVDSPNDYMNRVCEISYEYMSKNHNDDIHFRNIKILHTLPSYFKEITMLDIEERYNLFYQH